MPRPSAGTEHLLKADPVLGALVEVHGELDADGRTRGRPEDAYGSLLRAIREVGMSRAKASYLRSLAEHVLAGELEPDRLTELPDEEVSAQLTAVKGLGQWTADMFLIFHLRRPDVLAVGDLGVRRAVQLAYGLDELPSAAELTAMAEPWRPHRSLACLYLWRSLDNEPA